VCRLLILLVTILATSLLLCVCIALIAIILSDLTDFLSVTYYIFLTQVGVHSPSGAICPWASCVHIRQCTLTTISCNILKPQIKGILGYTVHIWYYPVVRRLFLWCPVVRYRSVYFIKAQCEINYVNAHVAITMRWSFSHEKHWDGGVSLSLLFKSLEVLGKVRISIIVYSEAFHNVFKHWPRPLYKSLKIGL